MNKSRLEAFSDGVIAIIITIMILEIKIPHGKAWSDLDAVLDQFVCYILSFLFIAIYWVNHHHLLHTIKQVSSGIMWANMTLLFFLSLVPLATEWMGENDFATNTVAVYGVIAFLSGVSFTILQKQVEKHQIDKEGLKIAFKKLGTKGTLSTFLYLTAIVFAFIKPFVSAMLFFLVSMMWLIPDKDIETYMQKHNNDKEN